MDNPPQWLRESGGHRDPYDLGLAGTDWFWSVIDQFRADPESAESLIAGMPPERLAEFYYAYREATDELYGDDRDDERGWDWEDIHNASCWVVNQGRDIYTAVWDDLRKYPDPKQVAGVDYSGLAAHHSWERHRQELCG